MASLFLQNKFKFLCLAFEVLHNPDLQIDPTACWFLQRQETCSVWAFWAALIYVDCPSTICHSTFLHSPEDSYPEDKTSSTYKPCASLPLESCWSSLAWILCPSCPCLCAQMLFTSYIHFIPSPWSLPWPVLCKQKQLSSASHLLQCGGCVFLILPECRCWVHLSAQAEPRPCILLILLAQTLGLDQSK